jgi:predicted Zn-dependent protease
VVLVVIAFSGPRAAAGAAQAGVQSPSLSVKAAQLASSGEAGQAIKILAKELELHPADLEARLTLAGIYLDQGDRTRAETEFRQALSSHPRSDRAALALGKFYLRVGSLGEAEQVLAGMLRSHPQRGEARWQLTLTLAGEHKYGEAAENLSLIPAPAAPQERSRYYRTAASIHSGLGEKKRAAEDMEKALRATPDDPQLRMLAGLTAADASEWNECAQTLEPLFRQHPTAKIGLLLLQAQLATQADFSSTLEALRHLSLPENQGLELAVRSGELLAQAERHREAAQEFEFALGHSGGEPGIAYNLAVERYAAGEMDAALEGLTALRQTTDSAEVEDLIAEIEEQRGDAAAAIRDHETAVKLAPSEERYRLTLGTALLRSHAFQPAEEVFEKAIQAFPHSARSYVGLALATYMMEQYEQSATAFLRAEQLDNDSGRILNYLGSTQAENPSGPSPQAIDAVCARADAHPRDPLALKWCGALLFRKIYLAGDQAGTEAAITRLRSAAALAPGDPVSSCFLGRALFWNGKAAEARHWLETCVRLEPESSEEHYRLSLVYQALNLRSAAAHESALAEALKAKAGPQSPGDPVALEILDAPARPTLHTEIGKAPPVVSPRN